MSGRVEPNLPIQTYFVQRVKTHQTTAWFTSRRIECNSDRLCVSFVLVYQRNSGYSQGILIFEISSLNELKTQCWLLPDWLSLKNEVLLLEKAQWVTMTHSSNYLKSTRSCRKITNSLRRKMLSSETQTSHFVFLNNLTLLLTWAPLPIHGLQCRNYTQQWTNNLKEWEALWN